MKNICLLTAAITLLISSAAHADRTVWYVHPHSALNTIQAGLDSCSDNDTVLVAPGTYFENIVWPNTQGIHLMSENGPEVTIIDGDSAGHVIECSSKTDSTTSIVGFTIRNGFASGGIPDCHGGGIFCDSSGLTVVNNVFLNNVAEVYGGGIYCGPPNIGCEYEISNNTFINNTAGQHGGGISMRGYHHANVVRNMISDNSSAQWGGGISFAFVYFVWFRNNTIINNSASWGGGVAICEAGAIYTRHNLITLNTAYFSGDGIYIDSITAALADSNCIHNNGCGLFKAYDYSPCSAENNWWGDSSGPYHPTLNPGGLGDTVSDYVDFIPWLTSPVGVEEHPTVRPVERQVNFGATIFRGPLQLPKGKECKVYDITGRVVEPTNIAPGIYFLEVDNKIVQKVIKVR